MKITFDAVTFVVYCIYMKHSSNLVILSILLLFISCNKEEKVDESKSSFYYYSNNKNKILYITRPLDISRLWDKYINEMEADPGSFIVLSQTFGKDKNYFYFKSNKITNVDYETGYYDKDNNILKDKSHVFTKTLKESNNLLIVEGADPESFHFLRSEGLEITLNDDWAKDKNNYFFKYKKIDIADYLTFTLLSSTYAYDKECIYYVADNIDVDSIRYTGSLGILSSRIVYDDYKLYVQQSPLKEGVFTVSYKNINTFKIYENAPILVFRVDDNVFWSGEKIDAIDFDADSYEIIDNSYYGKDKNNIYYQEKKIEGTDRGSFQVLPDKDKGSNFAKDKNRAYYGEKEFPYTVDLNSFEIDKRTKQPQDKNYRWRKMYNKPWERIKR